MKRHVKSTVNLLRADDAVAKAISCCTDSFAATATAREALFAFDFFFSFGVQDPICPRSLLFYRMLFYISFYWCFGHENRQAWSFTASGCAWHSLLLCPIFTIKTYVDLFALQLHVHIPLESILMSKLIQEPPYAGQVNQIEDSCIFKSCEEFLH